MEENYRIAIAQVKANNISAARIEWIQKLRPLMTEVITIVTNIESTVSELNKYIQLSNSRALTDNEQQEGEKAGDKLIELIDTLKPIYNQIRLFLNKDEKEHIAFIEAFDQFLSNTAEILDQAEDKKSHHEEIEVEVTEDDLIDMARTILKNAWEQAKNIS